MIQIDASTNWIMFQPTKYVVQLVFKPSHCIQNFDMGQVQVVHHWSLPHTAFDSIYRTSHLHITGKLMKCWVLHLLIDFCGKDGCVIFKTSKSANQVQFWSIPCLQNFKPFCDSIKYIISKRSPIACGWNSLGMASFGSVRYSNKPYTTLDKLQL